MDNTGQATDQSLSQKFRLENGTLYVLVNLYPYLLRGFEQMCQRLLKFPNRNLSIDLTSCDFISTVFLSTMIRTHLAAQREDRKLALRIGPSLEQFFIYASLDKTFNIEVCKSYREKPLRNGNGDAD